MEEWYKVEMFNELIGEVRLKFERDWGVILIKMKKWIMRVKAKKLVL